MEKAAKDEALLTILSALGSSAQEEASPSKKASANTGLSYAASVDREDPVKPLPWTGFPEVQEEVAPMPYYSDSFVPETTFSGAVSFAGGLDPEAQSVLGGLGMPGGQDMVGDRTVTDLEDLDVTPMRRRRSPTVEALAAAKDAFDFISGVDPNSYMGKTLELMNKYDKTRMEEDPEGYQADMNRAKVLSQKAQEETDPVKRAIYGREIKKLLPKETEGLSDEVAADYFTAGLDNKLKLEQLKGYNKLQQIQAQNQNKLDVQSLKNMSASEIANAKNQTQWDIASLNNEYKKAIADGNNERALTVAQMITDRQESLANLNNAAKLTQENMRQGGQNYRTELQQTEANRRAALSAQGAMDRVQAQQAGAMARAELQAKSALERAKLSADGKKKEDTAALDALIEMRTSPERMNEMKALNESAGRWAAGGLYDLDSMRATESAQAYQQFEGIAKQMVQDQLRKIYGAQFTEKEGERFFKSMGLNPTMDPSVRWKLLINALNDLRVKSGKAPLSLDAPKTSNPGIMKVGETQQVGNFKVTRRS